VRTGRTLHFFAADGADAEYKEFHSTGISGDAIKTLQAYVGRGGRSQGSVEVRLLGLSVRAEQLQIQPTTETEPAGRWRGGLWIGIGDCLLAGAALACYWLIKRQQRSSLQGTGSAPKSVSLEPKQG